MEERADGFDALRSQLGAGGFGAAPAAAEEASALERQGAREADALARVVIETRGFGEAFGHSLGHGLGLEVHEAPSVSSASDDVIPAGAVVTVEPGAYFPGWGGVRIEDDVHLTADSAEMLSEDRPETFELS